MECTWHPKVTRMWIFQPLPLVSFWVVRKASAWFSSIYQVHLILEEMLYVTCSLTKHLKSLLRLSVMESWAERQLWAAYPKREVLKGAQRHSLFQPTMGRLWLLILPPYTGRNHVSEEFRSSTKEGCKGRKRRGRKARGYIYSWRLWLGRQIHGRLFL